MMITIRLYCRVPHMRLFHLFGLTLKLNKPNYLSGTCLEGAKELSFLLKKPELTVFTKSRDILGPTGPTCEVRANTSILNIIRQSDSYAN